jgi:hypothetical protein
LKSPSSILCGYRILRPLGDTTHLGVGDDSRQVVIKKLDTDCLLGNKLHPSIAERLNRVRELAHGAVANLYAVARDGDEAYLIWQYLPGRTWDEFIASKPIARDRLLAARELILNVDLLHMQGIVHGSLIGSNIILGEDNTWRLTHISPLLYSDPAVDVESVAQLLTDAAGDDNPALSRLLADADVRKLSLRALAAKVAAMLESNGDVPPDVEESPRRELRLRTIGLALAVTLLAVGLAYAIWRAFATP